MTVAWEEYSFPILSCKCGENHATFYVLNENVSKRNMKKQVVKTLKTVNRITWIYWFLCKYNPIWMSNLQMLQDDHSHVDLDAKFYSSQFCVVAGRNVTPGTRGIPTRFGAKTKYFPSLWAMAIWLQRILLRRFTIQCKSYQTTQKEAMIHPDELIKNHVMNNTSFHNDPHQNQTN